MPSGLPGALFRCAMVSDDFLTVTYFANPVDAHDSTVTVRCVEEDVSSGVNLTPADARRLARRLNELADRAEGIDA